MAFRRIRPSLGESSTFNNPQSTPETSSSDPHHADRDKDSDNGGKRRRVPESVTRNACLNCKKARSKCDGKKPCKRCTSRNEIAECIYEIHIKHAKEELVKQIKQLKAKDHLTELIFQALSTDEKVPGILERLKNGETYERIVEWLGRTPLEDLETISPREPQDPTFEDVDHEMQDHHEDTIHWTSVTLDSALLDHLFSLYFSWVHPVHTLFSEGHFVKSYQHKLVGYCSPVLVNALCAVACHLHSPADGEDVLGQLGEEFNDAARASINPEDTSVTTIQAFAVLFLVDSARGNGLRASSYLRIATEGISRITELDVDVSQEVWKNTVRGIHNLNVEWAQVTFQVPPAIIAPFFDNNDSNEEQLDETPWHYYRFVDDKVPAWPSLLATTNREKSKLIQIIQDVATAIYAKQGRNISAHQVLHLYGRFVTWRNDLPTSIERIQSNNGQALPHVISLLVLYSSSVVQLLRPLLKFDGFPSCVVEDIVWNHAQQGLSLLDGRYRTQFTCRYQPVLQMFGVLHLADVIARFFPGGIEGGSKDGPEAIQFGIEALEKSNIGFPMAGYLQEMLRRTMKECSIRLPGKPSELMPGQIPPKNMYSLDDLIGACTRPTYVQPVAEIRQRYLSSFSADWIATGADYGFFEPRSGVRDSRMPSAEEIGAQSLMQIRNVLNEG